MTTTTLTPQQAATAWNLRHPVGTPVEIQAPAGNWCPTRTRSTATVSADRPVVCVVDYPGEFPLDIVRPAESRVGGAA